MTHRVRSLQWMHWITFCQWDIVNISSAAACCVSMCIELCTHKPEHWWLFSSSIVNGTGFVWKQERPKQRESTAAGLRPNSVCSKILGITHTQIQIYQWSLHNLSSHWQWQQWITMLLVLKCKVHVISLKPLCHRDETLSFCFSKQSCKLVICPLFSCIVNKACNFYCQSNEIYKIVLTEATETVIFYQHRPIKPKADNRSGVIIRYLQAEWKWPRQWGSNRRNLLCVDVVKLRFPCGSAPSARDKPWRGYT